MAGPAERMMKLRQRRLEQGRREVRVVVPDARSAVIRRRIAEQVAALDPNDEDEAMRWIEAVSEFDRDAAG